MAPQNLRHGGLGHAEAEHAKLAMEPRDTPEKVLTGHPCDQIADLIGNPGTSTSTVDQCDGSMGARFGYAPARQSDGAARSFPVTAR